MLIIYNNSSEVHICVTNNFFRFICESDFFTKIYSRTQK